MAEVDKKNLQAVMAQLRAEFARTLPERLHQMAHALRLARVDASRRDAYLEQARDVAHKLRGTAGSFGFLEVGEAAARIEDVVVPAQEGTHELTEELWASLEQWLTDASQAAYQRRDEGRPSTRATSTGVVLVVDNDDVFWKFVEVSARRDFVEVIRAKSAVEALAKARQFELDAALIDVFLEPRESAFRLAVELRSLPGYQTLPLAFVSVDGALHNRVAAAHAGASLYLPKPLTADDIRAGLRQLITTRHAERPRVLLVDDDALFAESIAVLLRAEGMRVNVLREAARILDALSEFRPDVLLLDVRMPGISGLDICRSVRAFPRTQDLPILVVTAMEGAENRVAVFEAGADDYLSKPIVKEELLARIRVRIERARLLRDRADKDPLTGLLSRRAFHENLSARLAEARRRDKPLSVCLLDVDHFKDVNDRHGHLAGDDVLATFGKLLTARFRLEDLRGRWGGEEFVLGFSGEVPETIIGAIGRMREEFRSIMFSGPSDASFYVTFSAGVASYPADGNDVEELLRAADRRLYLAKQTGRDRVVASD